MCESSDEEAEVGPVDESVDESVDDAYSFFAEYQGFYAERNFAPNGSKVSSAYKKKQSLEKRGKILNFDKADEATRKEILKARRTEWDCWKKFNAVELISDEHAAKLLKDGAACIGTQFVDTLKHDGRYKGRLVGRGDQEKEKVRSDSPTADVEVRNFILSFVASNKLMVSSAHIRNAYFQADKLSRVI